MSLYQRFRMTLETATDSSYVQKNMNPPALEVTSPSAVATAPITITLGGGYQATLSKNALMGTGGGNFGLIVMKNTSASKYITVIWTDPASTHSNQVNLLAGAPLAIPGSSVDVTMTAQSGAGTATAAVWYSDVVGT